MTVNIFFTSMSSPLLPHSRLSLGLFSGTLRGALSGLLTGSVDGRESWPVAPHGLITASFLCSGTSEIWWPSRGQLEGKLGLAPLRV